MEALEKIATSADFNAESSSDANNLLAAITKFEFILTLHIVAQVLGYLKGPSTKLQGRQEDILSGFESIDMVVKALKQVNLYDY